MAAVDQLQRDLDALVNQLAALKFQINPASGVRDNAVRLERDVSGNMVLVDVVTGSKTLAELAAGGGGGSATSRVITGTVTVDDNTVMVNHDVTINNGAALVIGDGAALVLV